MEEAKINISEGVTYKTATILFDDAKVEIDVKNGVPVDIRVSYPTAKEKTGIQITLDHYAVQDALKALTLYEQAILDIGKK
jgi:hypothetical protein